MSVGIRIRLRRCRRQTPFLGMIKKQTQKKPQTLCQVTGAWRSRQQWPSIRTSGSVPKTNSCCLSRLARRHSRREANGETEEKLNLSRFPSSGEIKMAEGMWPFFFPPSGPFLKRSDRMQLWSGRDGGVKKQRRSKPGCSDGQAEACHWVGEE